MSGLEVGFGSAIITPATPVQLAGFIDDQPATEVHDDLEVRAIFMRGEYGAVCLLVCDLLGMSVGFAGPVRDAVATALDLERAAVLTSCVHTHAGPSTLEGSQVLGWVTPDGYGEMLVRRCLSAALMARAVAAPATLRAGRWPLPPGLSVNRRGLPYEPTFAVLDVIGDGGARVGTVGNVAIHPVALGPECLAISSDWVGPFQSDFGLHAVRLRARSERRLPPFDEIRDQVADEFAAQRRRERNEAEYRRMRAHYEIVIEKPSAPSTATAPPEPRN